MNINPIHKASCHCGAVKYELILPDGVVDPRHCNCSMCRRRGAVVASVALDGLNITGGKEFLTLYQFNTMTAEHYFCSKCGIATFSKRRSNPNEYSYNIACIDGVNPFEIGKVKMIDGVNHIADR
jgi:hypothetical protein